MTIKGVEAMDNVWKPKLITGGKDSGIMIPNPDWLWDLSLGDVFFCKTNKPQTPSFVLQVWQIAAKLEQNGNRMMRLENPENPDMHFPVDTREFSREFKFHMLVAGVTEDGPGNPVEESGVD